MSKSDILGWVFILGILSVPVWMAIAILAYRDRKRIADLILARRLRLATITGYVAFGDKMLQLATIAPRFRRRLWEQRRRPRLIRRAEFIESQIGC